MLRVKANEGFTLVELLVSLALLSLMAIYAIQAFSTLRNMNRVEAEMAAQMEVDAVARHLRGELEETSAVFLPDGSAKPKLLFVGKSTTLTYIATSNGEREVGGLYLVNLALDADGTLKSSRQLIQVKISEHVIEVVLLRGIQSIQFTYFDNGPPQQAMPEWSAGTQLPKTIEISVTFAERDKRHWPKTLIGLQSAK